MSDRLKKQCANKSVKKEIPMNFYDFWLIKDIWSFYEAACLMNAIDPRLNSKQQGKQKFSKTTNSHARDYGYIGPNYAIDILKNADWSKYSFMPKNKKVKHDAVFELFKNKDLKIPHELTKAMEKIKPKVENIEADLFVSKEMATTLQPLIKIIEDFKECEDYKKYGKSIQQKKIIAWVKSQKLPQSKDVPVHFALTAAKYITKHYKITSSRKKYY